MQARVAARDGRLADLRVAAVLGAAAGISVLGLTPYLLQVMPTLPARIPVPFYVFMLAQAMQAALLCTGVAWLGLRLGHRVGLGAPLLQRWINGVTVPQPSPVRPLQACVAGIAVALLIVALASAIDPWLPASTAVQTSTDPLLAARNGLLASFYGGIAEELQLRLFLVTLLVWLATRRGGRSPSPRVVGGAILVAALAFGIGHLPAAANIWPLEAIVIIRVVVLNAIGGLVFGWLYWRGGLEMAIVGHFSADLVLHVAVPLSGLGQA